MWDTLKSTRLASFGGDALRALGPSEYARLISTLLRFGPMALRDRSRAQTMIGKSMGRRTAPLAIHFKGHTIQWDTGHLDKYCVEIPSFAIVQEMAIRGSYFRHHPETLPHFASAIDLGGNLGLFTLLLAPFSDKVVTVETDPVLCDLIRHNLAVNGIKHAGLENAYIGGAGMTPKGAASISLEELLRKHEVSQIGFIKIDIEGSEFELFESPSWLSITSYLSMEVHLEYGDFRLIKDRLETHGFEWSIADGTHFDRLPNDCDLKGPGGFILYARNKKTPTEKPASALNSGRVAMK
jgi:hypothetical protein